MLLFQKSRIGTFWVLSLLVILTTVTLTFDLLVSLGVAAGVPYVLVVFLSGWLPWRSSLFVAALVTSALTITGFFLSDPTEELWKAVTNRGLAMLVIWGTAILLYQRKSIEVELGAANEQLKHLASDRESRLTGVLHYIPEGVVVIDNRGIIDSVNPSVTSMFEYTEEELRGRNVSCLMAEPYRSEHDGYIARYLETGKGRIIDTGPREVRAMTKAGVIFPVELSVGLMHLDDDQVFFVGVMRDITDRKEVERKLLQSQKLLMMGQLASGVSHDFNNLLMIIQSNLELLEERLDNDELTNSYVDTIKRASYQAADVTRHLLAYARQQVLTPQSVDVNELVARTASLMDRTLGVEIEIETVLAAGLWRTVIDKGQLQNALINLIINARDAMPNGGKLTIETANTRLSREYASGHEEVTPGQYVMIAITDTGVGISQEILDRLFDPFFTTKEANTGVGLGLSMVFGFVKQSHGHIKAYSEPGEGTTVKIYLPRSLAGPRRGATESIDVRRPAGDETILVVEDDPEVRSFVVNGLEVLGYTVHAAKDGPAALEMLPSIGVVDLLITDVILPNEMNGKEVADEVRRFQPDMEVLFMSGYTDNAIVHRGVLDDSVELLVKPFSRDRLAQIVRILLDSRK